jgi:hypothetical protein
MNIPTFLAGLHRRGVILTVNGDRLHVEAPAGVLTDDVKAELSANKSTFLSILTTAIPCPGCGGWCLRTNHVLARDGRAYHCANHRCCGRVIWIQDEKVVESPALARSDGATGDQRRTTARKQEGPSDAAS